MLEYFILTTSWPRKKRHPLIRQNSPASMTLGNVMLTSNCCNIDLRGKKHPKTPQNEK